jgi:hypothetical protein
VASESDRLAWLKKLRATKASSGLRNLMLEKGWIEMADNADLPPWEDEKPAERPSPATKPRRERNDYFRNYMREYRAKKKAVVVTTTATGES